VSSYSILAPNAVPAGFVDGKVASEKVLAALDLGDNYRIGHTKVFFKAGILGQLEEMREEKLSSIFANFQARIRGYLIRKNYTKLCDQRSGTAVTRDHSLTMTHIWPTSSAHRATCLHWVFFKKLNNN